MERVLINSGPRYLTTLLHLYLLTGGLLTSKWNTDYRSTIIELYLGSTLSAPRIPAPSTHFQHKTVHHTSLALVILTSLRVVQQCGLALSLLAMAGDIQPNPGPTHLPLKCAVINSRSLKAICKDPVTGLKSCKISLFNNMVYAHSYDIVAVTETWLTSTIKVSELLEYGYSIYRRDRKDRVGGGVLLAIKSSIESNRRLDLEGSNIESVCVELSRPNSRKLLLNVVYRPPNADIDFMNHFSNQLTNMQRIQRSNCLILGDFNLPNINWIDFSGFSNMEHDLLFSDILKDNGLFQLNTSSTFFSSGNSTGSILDLIITNEPNIISNIEAHTPESCNFPTDHHILDFNLCQHLRRRQTATCYNFCFKNADFDAIRKEIRESTKFLEAVSNVDIDVAWSAWMKALKDTIMRHVPLKRVRDRSTPPWFDSELKHLLKKKETARRKYLRTNLSSHKAKFVDLRRQCKKSISIKHKLYVTELCEQLDSNPKRFWSYFRAKSKSNTIPDNVKHNGQQVSEPAEKAEAFNQFFYSTFIADDNSIPPTDALEKTHPGQDVIGNITLTLDEVEKALTQLNPFKAHGPDNIPTIVLKRCASELSPSLLSLYNKSLSSGCLPCEWKKSYVVPVHKKQRKDMVANYRPISLLCIVSKVLERCVFNHTIHHLSDSLSTCQHGFLHGRSTVTQLLGFVHKIGLALDKGQQSDVIYLDFAKAFDSVSHSRLIFKLHHYGVQGPLLNWFGNYLSNRFQYTIVQGAISSPLPVTSGVPQGSILGPLLFLVYINDLPSIIDHSHIGLFADDSKCYRTISNNSDCETLQEDLDNLYEWSKAWRLNFNVKKCEALTVTRKLDPIVHPYSLNGNIIDQSSKQRDLGVIISKDLKWHQHIQHTLSKGYRILGFLRRHASKDFDVKAKRSLYNALIRPHIGYASQVWSPSLVGDIKSVEQLQRRATRFILPNSDLDYRERLVNLEILPVSYWHEMNDLTFFFKCRAGHYNFTIGDFVKPKTFSRSTRYNSTMDMTIPRTRTKQFQHSYFNRIPKLWNILPLQIKSLVTVSKFKTALRRRYFAALNITYHQDSCNTWKSICPKCCSTNDIIVNPSCCY